MVMIGYEKGSKAYKLYNPESGKVCVSRDVVFEENKGWNWDGVEGHAGSADEEWFMVHTEQEPAGSSENPEMLNDPNMQVQEHDAELQDSVCDPDSQNIVEAHDGNPVTENQETPVKLRSLEDLYDETSPSWSPDDFDHMHDLELCMLGADEPVSHIEALKHDSWKQAMEEEMKSIHENGTWELDTLPIGAKAIGLKWVFKLKKDAAENVVKHKARLVAKGYVQRQRVDFDEVFAPVARMDTVGLLIALAARENWEVHHMDVKSAFLNGELEEEVFVAQPPGFEEKSGVNKVLKLKKALYGLRQAPRAWNLKLDQTLLSLGFERSPLEHAVYKRKSENSCLLVGVYVDDLIITGPKEDELLNFKLQMKDLFSMSDLGLLTYYLGIEVNQSEKGITLCQSSYAMKILEKTGMSECNIAHTPMEQRMNLSKNCEGSFVEPTTYRSLIASLRYLLNSRSDLAYSVGLVSRFMEKPNSQHMAAVKQILRYVRSTLNFGCCYERGEAGKLGLVGFSDSDHAGDIDDRKSTTGMVFLLGKSPIAWMSQKQKVVALSSCEAEYIAAATVACHGVWLERLLAEMVERKPEKVLLFVDNKSAISLSKNPVHHQRSKHIDTRFHFIRECVEEGKVGVEHVVTEEQLADLLTEPWVE